VADADEHWILLCVDHLPNEQYFTEFRHDTLFSSEHIQVSHPRQYGFNNWEVRRFIPPIDWAALLRCSASSFFFIISLHHNMYSYCIIDRHCCLPAIFDIFPPFPIVGHRSVIRSFEFEGHYLSSSPSLVTASSSRASSKIVIIFYLIQIIISPPHPHQ